jgi:hypothetical protein
VYRLYINAFRACSRLYSHLEDFYTDLDNEDTNTDLDTDTKAKDDLDPKDRSNTNY